MNKDQEFTPKYWAGHNIESDDVFLVTASKSYEYTVILMNMKFGDNWQDDENLQIDLFEIKLVEKL